MQRGPLQDTSQLNCQRLKIKNLKSSKRKAVSYLLMGVPRRLWADFSKETLYARRDRQEIFKVMKSSLDLQPRLFYKAKLSFRIEAQIKIFPDKKKLKEFIITKPLLYEMLKGLI